jgi:predicted kinase
LPGSGKSTLANLLGRKLHGTVLASDVVRKKMFTIDLHTRIDLSFEEGIYSPQASALTYGRLLLLAQTQLEKGELVILDATFARSHHRQEVVRLAQTTGCHYLFIHCWAPKRIILARLAAREHGAGVISDARSDQFNRHRARFAPLDDIDPQRLVQIQTHLSGDDALAAILSQLSTAPDR